MPVRCTILPPVPVPYREPLFARLAERGRVAPRVVYLSAGQAAWDMRADWFPAQHVYESEVLPRSRQRARAGRSPITIPRGLGAALRRARPECVVSWEYGPATWSALAWCRLRRRPLVIFSELSPWSDAELSAAHLRVHRLLAPRASGFVVASSQGRVRLERMGVDPRRVHVALQSADLAAFDGLARPAARGPVRFLTVARLVEDKNLARLIDAFARAGFGTEEASLSIAGGGPLEAALREHAARAGVPVDFLGFASPAELPAAYAQAGAFVLVSTYEPFGVAVREAAAAGLPIVCTERAGAAGDVAVQEENALLVDPEDTEAIATALRRLVREPGLRDRLAAGSRAVTERHPLEADVEAWEAAILQAGATTRRAGGA